MAYGITPKGFVRKTNETIVQEFQDNWRSLFGNDSDLSQDSVNSILIGLLSIAIDDLWQQLEVNYNSLNRNAASGVALDNAVALIGITREPAAPSTAEVSFLGDNNILIPLQTQVKQSSTDLVFVTLFESFITQSACNLIRVTINEILINTIYRINIDGNTYSYRSDNTATVDEIIAGLANQIALADIGVNITNEGSSIMLLEAENKNDVYNISFDSKFIINKVQSIIEVECLELGVNNIPPQSINTISQAIAGLDSVLNYNEGNTGRGVETDQELRLRAQQNIAVAGFNFVEAIQAKLLNEVTGVSYCRVYENETLQVDSNGIPPKAWEAVVEGGADKEIASALYSSKIAGIQTYGNLTVEITKNKIPYYISFSRAENIFIWVKISITSYNQEESFPINGEIAIKEAILSFARSTFSINDNIILEKFYTPLYTISGIGSANISLAYTLISSSEVPIFSFNNINCGYRQRPIFSLDQIVINLI